MSAATGLGDPEYDVCQAAELAASIPAGAVVTAAALEDTIRAAEEQVQLVRECEDDPELDPGRRYAAGQAALAAECVTGLFRRLLATAGEPPRATGGGSR